MAYSVYLDGLLLPITPSKIQLTIMNQNKTINLINEGEVNILKSAGLTGITFDAVIPQVVYPFAVYPNGFLKADHFLNRFKSLKVKKEPFQFVCSRVSPAGNLLFETNLTVSLEDYRITEDANLGLDLTVTINLKEFKPYGTKTGEVKIVTKSSSQSSSSKLSMAVSKPRPAGSAPKKTTYTVKKGDSLWLIAKKYLGNGSRYTEIYKLNKDKIKNVNLIYAGQVLLMPS